MRIKRHGGRQSVGRGHGARSMKRRGKRIKKYSVSRGGIRL